MSEVLRELRSPVQRWQVLTAAELYGADQRTLAALHRLARLQYESLGQIVDEVVAQPPVRRGGAT